MPKPKKLAPTVTEPEPMDGMDTVESEMPSPMPSPEPPEPTQRSLLEPPQADITEDFDIYDRAPILVRVYRKQMVAAERQFNIIKRRWERKKRTYIDSGKYSPWAEASRCEAHPAATHRCGYGIGRGMGSLRSVQGQVGPLALVRRAYAASGPTGQAAWGY